MLAGKSASITDQIDINQVHRQGLLPRAHSSQARSAIQCQTRRLPWLQTTGGRASLSVHPVNDGTKAAAILSPPPPVSLFPQSLSLFPSLRQLSRTCTTQRVPCVALPIAAFPARLPRPSSNKLLGLVPTAFGALHNKAALCSHWYVPRAVVVRGLRAFVAPQPSPPARRALASPPVTAAGLRARAGAVLLFAGSAVQPSSCPLLAFLARRNQRVQHPPLNLSRSVPKRACFSPFIDPGLTRLQTAALVSLYL